MIATIRPNAAEYLRENSNTTTEDVINESFNDPGFFRWLFDDDSLPDYADLTEEQSEAFYEFLSTF